MREAETVLSGGSQEPEGTRPPRTATTSADKEPTARVETCRRVRGGEGLATLAVLLISLATLAPTVGDFGLTWDEPAYRYSQLLSAQWWEQMSEVRSWRAAAEALDPLTLLYYWPYGRHGINFHPPLAGQLNLATHALFGHWMKDIPARRMASVFEFALTITIGFHFLARRYGAWVGLVAAGSLLCMPRLYGQAHLIDTDTPGLLIWSATALAFWNGLHMPKGRRWRVAVGILVGLAFIEKMGVVMVLLPLLLWLLAGYLPRSLTGSDIRATWIDGTLTTGAMLIPLGIAFQQIQILQQQLPPPHITDLFIHRPASDWPGAILAVPLLVWCLRRVLGWCFPKSKIWGAERPGLETWTSILAFAPLVAWLGNPAWWRETLVRLAHYYTLNVDRQHSLPNIQIIYFGQIYEFSLPWHNGWVLMGITVPVAILAAGGDWGRVGRRPNPQRPAAVLLPGSFPDHAGDPNVPDAGARRSASFPADLFLSVGVRGLGRDRVGRHRGEARPASLPLLTAGPYRGRPGLGALALYHIHPYELSYYNELIGGPRQAWEKGFELTYWYDAFTDKVIADINHKLPPNPEIDFFNDLTETSVWVFQDRQTLGTLRGDITLAAQSPNQFPFIWLLTQDSKAVAFTRLLFVMRPWYSSRPSQLDGVQVAAVADPVAVSRAFALKCLLDAPDLSGPPPPAAPLWVRDHLPWLARLWGDGLIKPKRLTLSQNILEWSRSDPAGLLAAARFIAAKRPVEHDENAQRLMNLLSAGPNRGRVKHYLIAQLLARRPQALIEAVQILNARRDQVVAVMTRSGYTDPQSIGGYLDRDLPIEESPGLGK